MSEKTQILCAASGVELGALVRVYYDWTEVTYVFQARCQLVDCTLKAGLGAPEIQPENIEADETVTFVWELL